MDGQAELVAAVRLIMMSEADLIRQAFRVSYPRALQAKIEAADLMLARQYDPVEGRS